MRSLSRTFRAFLWHMAETVCDACGERFDRLYHQCPSCGRVVRS